MLVQSLSRRRITVALFLAVTVGLFGLALYAWQKGRQRLQIGKAIETGRLNAHWSYHGPAWLANCITEERVDTYGEWLIESLHLFTRMDDLYLNDHSPSDPTKAPDSLRVFGGSELRELMVYLPSIDPGWKHLATMRHLEGLDPFSDTFQDDWLLTLESCRRLKAVNLKQATITSQGLQVVRNWPQLTELSLESSRVDDAGLVALESLTELQNLDLSNTSITDDGLKSLSRLLALERLSLANTRITGRQLSELSKLPKIKFLDLRGTQVDDAALESLANLQKLQALRLGGTRASGRILTRLSSSRTLEVLDVSDLPVSDAEFAALRPAANLKAIDLGGTRVTAQSLATLREFPKLESLHLTGKFIDDAAVSEIVRIPSLQILTLRDTSVTPNAFASFNRLANLKLLVLKNKTMLAEVGSKQAAAAWKFNFYIDYPQGTSMHISEHPDAYFRLPFANQKVFFRNREEFKKVF